VSCCRNETVLSSAFAVRASSLYQTTSELFCLEDNGEDCQNCSVLYCVTQFCTIKCTLIWAVLTDELFLRLDSVFFLFWVWSVFTRTWLCYAWVFAITNPSVFCRLSVYRLSVALVHPTEVLKLLAIFLHCCVP